jgi:ABC-type transport system involved in multi-copper enzyme maturation permease subunit
MYNIARTEWLKIKKYPAFWWVMGITALTYPGINYMFIGVYKDITEKRSASGQMVKALIGNPFSFPEAWRTVAFFSSLFVFIPAIVIIKLITNEYTYRTNRQNIIDGWSRKNFMTGKLIDVIILSIIVTALYTIIALLIGFANTTNSASDKWKLLYYIGLFSLQTFSQLSLAFMTGLLIRKSFIALAVFAFYSIIVEPISVNVLKHKYNNGIGEYFPMEISDRLVPVPAFMGRIDEVAYQTSLNEVNPHIGYTFLLILITWSFCFWINNRRDL